MRRNGNIFIIFCGLGYPRYDEFRLLFPDRAINVGASEQTGLDIACGLSISGKIPFIYSITPFLLWRGAETIRTYINHEALNVKLIGAGRDDEYSKDDGFSHDATDGYLLMEILANIHQFYPEDEKELKEAMDLVIHNDRPSYINIRR